MSGAGVTVKGFLQRCSPALTCSALPGQRGAGAKLPPPGPALQRGGRALPTAPCEHPHQVPAVCPFERRKEKN